MAMATENTNGGIHLDFDESTTAAATVRPFADDAWRKHLICAIAKDGTVGGPKAILANVVTALRFAPEWSGVLAHNEFSLHVTTKKPAPWQTDSAVGKNWTDYEDSRGCEWMQHEGIVVSSKVVAEAVQTVAKENQFHPVRDYLRSLKWDGRPRIDEWLIRHMGAEDSIFVRAVGGRWLISAVARIFDPGCQVDHVLLLEGDQGVRKSSGLRVLTVRDEWFVDHTAELGSKDSRLDLSGKWIVEMAELDKVRGAALERVKAFLTVRYDHFRMPYGRRAEDVPRSCAFAGSVNDATPLTDATGNRRFWPVKCGNIDLGALTADRDQLWAEAYSRYRAGDPWYLDTPELNKAAVEQQDLRFDDGVWDQIILDWLEDPQQRYERNRDQDLPIQPFDSTSDAVTITDVLIHCVGKPLDRCEQKDRNQVARCLIHNGWRRKQSGKGPKRGKWFYVREGSDEPA
jgi:putative DNA primase/helicase